MLTAFLSGLYLFLFIFAWYIILMFAFNVMKVFYLKTGKLDINKWTSPVIGMALAYIIMALIIGL